MGPWQSPEKNHQKNSTTPQKTDKFAASHYPHSISTMPTLRQRLARQFFSVLYDTDPKQTATLLRFVVGTLLCGAIIVFGIAISFQWIPAMRVTGFNIVLLICMGVLLRFGQTRLVSVVVVTTIWASITYIISGSDGIHDVSIILFPLVIAIGSLIFNRLYFVMLTLLCMGSVLCIGSLELAGIVETQYAAFSEAGDVIVAAVLIALSAIIIRVLTDYSLTALQHSLKNESQYREIFNNLHDAVFIQDKDDGSIIDVNDTMLSMYGYQRDELKHFKRGVENDSQYNAERAREHLKTAALKGTHQYKWKARKKDGSTFWVDVIMNRVEIGGKERIVAIVRDIDQEFRLQEQLRQTEKLTAIGELAGGIAHDFNNMLAGIMGAAEVLALKPFATEELKLIDMIIRTSERAGELTEKLLTFSKKRDLVLDPIDLHSIIHDVIDLLSRSVSKTITLETRLEAQHRTIQGDRAELINLFLNLGVNACDAMGEKGKLLFTSHMYIRPDADEPNKDQSLGAGPHICISVIDSGCGIPEDIQARIFEPFFSTKDKSQRTGLGLAAVYGATGKHNGLIEIAESNNTGTTFRVHLPLIDDVFQEDELDDELQRGEGHILIVDDEEALLTTSSMMLEQAGYKCLQARNGREALTMYREHNHDIDLVLLDMLMPDMSGKECFLAMQQEFPDAQIIICSGFTEDHSVTALLEQGALGFIKKPYRMKEFLNEIKIALQS